jgi:predicted metalloprotease
MTVSKKAGTAGAAVMVIALIAVFMGVDPEQIMKVVQQSGSTGSTTTSAPAEISPEQQELADMVAVVLADTEDVWHQLFAEQGMAYQEPKLVLFSDAVQSACGMAESAVGPFYCPADRNVYIDLSFYRDLQSRHNAPGDFAQAYVVAHEIGHHVQNLLGASDKLHAARGRVTEKEYNDLSVRLELQADFYAGVWAHHANKMRQILEPGDVEEALNAASAIGDDRLQKQARGYVTPDSFTHGSSEQRVRWFRRGLETGDLAQGDTFGARSL